MYIMYLHFWQRVNIRESIIHYYFICVGMTFCGHEWYEETICTLCIYIFGRESMF